MIVTPPPKACALISLPSLRELASIPVNEEPSPIYDDAVMIPVTLKPPLTSNLVSGIELPIPTALFESILILLY